MGLSPVQSVSEDPGFRFLLLAYRHYSRLYVTSARLEKAGIILLILILLIFSICN